MFTSSSTTRTRSGEPSARVRSAVVVELMVRACPSCLCVSCEEPARLPCGFRAGAQGQHRSPQHAATMSDTEPTAAQPPEHQPLAAPVPDRPRLRDRLFGLRALVAVAVAGVVLGGL